MHEVGLAYDIMEIVCDFAERNNLKKVASIRIEAGECSGIMIPALKMGLESAKKNTVAQDAMMDIDVIPGKITCEKCGSVEDASTFARPCHECGSLNRRITQGKEFRIRSIQAR